MQKETFITESKRILYFFLIRTKLTLKNAIYEKKESKFLFILSPPYCGSTLLNQIISTSEDVSCNNHLGTREGQLLPGVKRFMFQKNRWDENVKYDWKKIKNVWMRYWDQSKSVLLDKSIPNIMRVNAIKKEFKNIFFICMVRNPYAQVEGIIRRNEASAEYAANFAIKCLKYQKLNIEKEKNLLFFTYEQLCEDQNTTIQKIIDFIPELFDIKTNIEFNAHNYKTKGGMSITNLNQEKITKLSSQDILTINTIFKKNISLLTFFNYQIIDN